MTTAAIFGCTGLVGNHILATALASDSFSSVHTISRRAPKTGESAKLHSVLEGDNTKWTSQLGALSPFPSIVFSAVGSTRQQAGGIENQWKIDHDLNVELAKAAKAGGAKTFVFVSSAGVRDLPSRLLPYSKMKIGVEDAIKELDFEQAIILRPGLIMGERAQPHQGAPLMIGMAKLFGKISAALQDNLAQDCEVIGRATVRAAELAAQGKAPSKYWTVERSDIVRLGRDEWKV